MPTTHRVMGPNRRVELRLDSYQEPARPHEQGLMPLKIWATRRSRTDSLPITKRMHVQLCLSGLGPSYGADPCLRRYKGRVVTGRQGLVRVQRVERWLYVWKTPVLPQHFTHS